MKKILSHAEFSRRGGKAGTGKAKARTSEQARAAVNARWARVRLAKQVCDAKTNPHAVG